MSVVSEKLDRIQKILTEPVTCPNASRVLSEIGLSVSAEDLSEYRLWNDYMPLSDEIGHTEEKRNLHILWELIDKSPIGINCAFAIPYRQLIAKKLFKKCGDGFVAAEGCRFNFGENIEVGENVSWNMGCYVDSKGGVTFGDFAMMTEYVKIFTHSHSEIDHMVRSYAPVHISDYAKLYTNCTILPGIIVGKGAIVATGSVVTKSVDDFTLVSGVPAKPMRLRHGQNPAEYNQYMMKNRLFQK